MKLCYRETVPDKSTALKRECAIKRLNRSEKLALITEKTMLDIDRKVVIPPEKECEAQ